MSIKRLLSSFVAILFVATLFFPTTVSAADDIWEGTEGRTPPHAIQVLGIGGYEPDQTTGKHTFKGLVGLGVTSDIRFNKIPLQGVSIKAYDDVGGRNPALYEDKVPVAETVSGDVFLNDEAQTIPYQRYRNFSIEIPGFVGQDRDLVFVCKLAGYEPFGVDGYLRPVNVYSVTFESNEGTAVDPITDLLINSKVTEPSIPTKENYDFGGWYKEPELINKWVFNTDTVTKNTTLYAKWIEPSVPKVYKVTYTDGVDGKEIFKNQTYTVAENNKTPAYTGTPTRTGYIFKGWDPKVTKLVTKDVVYNAQWEKIGSPSISTVDPKLQSSISSSKVASPKTGDNSTIIPMAGIAALSLAGMITVFVLTGKKKKNG